MAAETVMVMSSEGRRCELTRQAGGWWGQFLETDRRTFEEEVVFTCSRVDDVQARGFLWEWIVHGTVIA
jgi:hypothetical protein